MSASNIAWGTTVKPCTARALRCAWLRRMLLLCCHDRLQGPACVCPPLCGFVMIVRRPGQPTYQTPAVCTFNYASGESGDIGVPLIMNPGAVPENRAWVATCGSPSGSGVTTPQFASNAFDLDTNTGPTTELGIDCQVVDPLPTTDGSCKCPTRVFPDIPPPA